MGFVAANGALWEKKVAKGRWQAAAPLDCRRKRFTKAQIGNQIYPPAPVRVKTQLPAKVISFDLQWFEQNRHIHGPKWC